MELEEELCREGGLGSEAEGFSFEDCEGLPRDGSGWKAIVSGRRDAENVPRN